MSNQDQNSRLPDGKEEVLLIEKPTSEEVENGSPDADTAIQGRKVQFLGFFGLFVVGLSIIIYIVLFRPDVSTRNAAETQQRLKAEGLAIGYQEKPCTVNPEKYTDPHVADDESDKNASPYSIDGCPPRKTCIDAGFLEGSWIHRYVHILPTLYTLSYLSRVPVALKISLFSSSYLILLAY